MRVLMFHRLQRLVDLKPELSLSLLVRFRLLVDGVPFAVLAVDAKRIGT